MHHAMQRLVYQVYSLEVFSINPCEQAHPYARLYCFLLADEMITDIPSHPRRLFVKALRTTRQGSFTASDPVMSCLSLLTLLICVPKITARGFCEHVCPPPQNQYRGFKIASLLPLSMNSFSYSRFIPYDSTARLHPVSLAHQPHLLLMIAYS